MVFNTITHVPPIIDKLHITCVCTQIFGPSFDEDEDNSDKFECPEYLVTFKFAFIIQPEILINKGLS